MSARVEALPGEGTLIRFGDIIVWVGTPASRGLVSFLVQSAQNLAPSPTGGRQIADYIAGRLSTRDPAAAAFVTLGPGDQGLATLLHGPAQLWDGVRWLAPTQSSGWFQAIVTPRPQLSAGAAGSSTPRLAPDSVWDLGSGVIEAGGFAYLPEPAPTMSQQSYGPGAYGAGPPGYPPPGYPTPGYPSGYGPGPAYPAGPAPQSAPPAPAEAGGATTAEPTGSAPSVEPATVLMPTGPAPSVEPPTVLGPTGPAPSVEPPTVLGPTGPAPSVEPATILVAPGAASPIDTGPGSEAAPAGTVDLRDVAAKPGAPLPAVGAPSPAVPGRPVVRGVVCPQGHFNHPSTTMCVRCGKPITERALVSGNRPSLGVLIRDDGTVYRLAIGYVVGSDPARDPTVTGGVAQALVLDGGDGRVAASHAELRLTDWEVAVVDRGSDAGTFVLAPGQSGWSRLPPFQAFPLQPGTHLALGPRTLTYTSPWPNAVS